MSVDKEKSYQDGRNGQPYNGRNWDEYAAGRSMSTANKDNTFYDKPKTSTDSWTPPEPFVGNSAPMTDRQARIILYIPLVLLGIGVVPVAALLSFPLALLLKKIETLLKSTEKKSYIGAYLTTVKALSAYGMAYIGTGLIIYLLGKFIITGGRFSIAANYLGSISYAILHGLPVTFIFFSGIMLLLQIPSLLAFVYVLRHDYPASSSRRRGFWQAGLTALGFAACAIALLSSFYSFISV